MKVFKRKAALSGFNITCVISERYYTTWFQNPPKSFDHVDIEYLKNRFPCITTERRANKFKELYKRLIEEEVQE